MSQITQKRRKIAMIIAPKNFRDEEYFTPKEIFEKNKIEVKTVSTEKGTAFGSEGGETEADLIEGINLNNFEAIVFIGGSDCLKYLDNQVSYNLIKQAVEKEKVVGAICIAPTILAKSGVLKNKKATVWGTSLDKSGIKTLEENGADYQAKPIVVDGKIITAWGADAAAEFAKKIIDLI